MIWRRLLYAGVVVLWAVSLVLVAKSALDRLPIEPWGNPIGGDSMAVAGETRVGQSFVAPLPGLYRIEVVLDRATAGSTQPITFHLKSDPTAEQDLWTATFSSADVQSGTAYSIEFPVRRDSKGRAYYFYLDSPESTPGEAVTVRYSPAAVLDGASAYLNDRPVAGDLQFHTFYSLRTRERLDLLLSRMAEGKPYLLGVKGFYVGLGLVYAAVLCAFLLQVARVILTEQEEKP